MLDFDYSEKQQQLQQQAREFALKRVLPIAAYYDEKDETPVEILKEAFEAGLSTGMIPEAYGGQGRGIVDGCLVTEEIAAACPGIATSLFDNSLGLEPLILSDNEEAKQKYLPMFVNSFNLISFATSEPTMGSDVSGIRCRAKEQGDHYILDGTKYWVTNGGIADYFTIFATVDPETRHEGICAFLVEKNYDGVETGRPIPKLGQRNSNTAGVHFNKVKVPRENMLAPPGKGFALAMKTFSRTRPSIGSFATGAARSAMEFAIDYAKKRRAFGSKLSDFQAIQFKIAEMYQKIETSRLLVLKAAWEADKGIDPTVSASISKFYSTEAAVQVANEALQIFGGYGYTRFYPVEKLFRDMRVYPIYEGTSEIQRMIVAGHALNNYKPVMPPLEELPVHRDVHPDEVGARGAPEESVWRCRVCGYVHYDEKPPEKCPYCFFPDSAFVQTDGPGKE
ncbi:MAG: acyl-CoA dehydrogenase family protein [Desulfobacterales bacterium]